MCMHEPRVSEYLRDDELSILGRIVLEWSSERVSGPDSRQQFLEQVLRGEDHVSLGLGSSVGAAQQAGLQGAASGAAFGHCLARSLSSLATRGSTPSAAGQVAAQALGVIGAVAGGLVGGVSSGLIGGARAGLQSRRVFVFVDRVFLRATFEQAWELAAQQLELMGNQPSPQEIEAHFLSKLQVILDGLNQPQVTNQPHSQVQEPRTRQGVWLRLVQLCLCLDLLHHISAPLVRVPLPAEHFTESLRLDQEFLGQRVQELASLLGEASKKRSALTAQEIDSRCPVTSLTDPVEDVCPVCLESFDMAVAIRRFPCNHIMHKECCEAWLKTAGTCPTCRHDVRSGAARAGQ